MYIGYEIVGLDRLPDSGPAMIIYYHGALPIDFYYVMAKGILVKHRQIHAIGDNFLFSIPGKIHFIILKPGIKNNEGWSNTLYWYILLSKNFDIVLKLTSSYV